MADDVVGVAGWARSAGVVQLEERCPGYRRPVAHRSQEGDVALGDKQADAASGRNQEAGQVDKRPVGVARVAQ